jgi:hypothetical protein
MVLCLILQCFAGIFWWALWAHWLFAEECFPGSRLYPVLSTWGNAFCHNHPESSNMKKGFERLLTSVDYITRTEVVTMLLKDFSTQGFVPNEVMLFHCLRVWHWYFSKSAARRPWMEPFLFVDFSSIFRKLSISLYLSYIHCWTFDRY